PRYDLKPGQVLTYEDEQTDKGKSGTSTYKTTWRLWVVGRNDDGSWRIVARTAMTGPSMRETGTFARFDLRPDGEGPPCASLGPQVDPAAVFPRLPRDEKQFADGWEARDDRDDATIRYKALASKGPGDADNLDFEADRRSFIERIYEGKDHRIFRFDRKQG